MMNRALILASVLFLTAAATPLLLAQEKKDTSPTQTPPDTFDPFAQNAAETLAKLDANLDQENDLNFLPPGIISELTKQIKPAVVSVIQKGRDGDNRGKGSGFVVTDTGLIATNFHVIGENRPIEVQFADGETRKVIEVTASDKKLDLALIRIEPGDRKLVSLPLGDSSKLAQGQIVAGFGSPQGLQFSVVPALISAIRELDLNYLTEGGKSAAPMIQVAMPIEMGNSGGPLLNLDGEVVGIVTLKHRVTENLGYAMLAKDLQTLLDQPNPIPIDRWITVGALDQDQWTTVMGATWTQRGGILTAEDLGTGFGGRSLCISKSKTPPIPYEVAVEVKLDNEKGAAGLAFASDGNEKHYGFYPSNGNIRLTRFEGPDIYTWTILDQKSVAAYKKGEWNHLRIRVEEDKIIGFVNGSPAVDLSDSELRGGMPGLCKFRNTVAEFRNFQIGSDLSEKTISPQTMDKFDQIMDQFLSGTTGHSESVRLLQKNSKEHSNLLLRKARSLENQAEEIRKLQALLHRQMITNELEKLLNNKKSDVDLFSVALRIAQIDNSSLDLNHYNLLFDRFTNGANEYLSEKSKPESSTVEKSKLLRDYLFKELGFHGSRTEYYHHANSYITHVLDDREGLPILLSVVFIELARRTGIKGVAGVPIPGRFMVGVWPNEESELPEVVFDVFDAGQENMQRELRVAKSNAEYKDLFQRATAQTIATRILRNLANLEIDQERRPIAALDYLEILLTLDPEAAHDRFRRALIRYQNGDTEGAAEDLDWMLEHKPPGFEYRRIEQLRESMPIPIPVKEKN